MSLAPNKPAAKKRPGDRRSVRKRAVAMCAHVADGKSLRAAADIEGLDHADFLGLVAKNDELRIRYETARAACVESRRSALSSEADTVMAVAKRQGKKASAYVSAFNVKANIAKWEAERLLPKVYGNRLDVNHSGAIDLAGRLSKARERTKA